MSTTTSGQHGCRCLQFALTALAALSLSAAQAQNDEPTIRTNHIAAHHLTVTGRGEVKVQPDKADITLGVVTEDRSSRNAAIANTADARKVENAVMQVGVMPIDVQTLNYSVEPVYGSEPNRPPGVLPPPHIVAYRVSNQVRVTVHNLAHIGAILDAATAGGSNTIENIAFGQKDQTAAEDEALRKAVADARRKAEQIASAADMQIVGIDELNEGTIQRPYPMVYSRAAFADASTPIHPGESTVTATVTIVYDVSPTMQSSSTRTGKVIARKR